MGKYCNSSQLKFVAALSEAAINRFFDLDLDQVKFQRSSAIAGIDRYIVLASRFLKDEKLASYGEALKKL